MIYRVYVTHSPNTFFVLIAIVTYDYIRIILYCYIQCTQYIIMWIHTTADYCRLLRANIMPTLLGLWRVRETCIAY